MAAQEPHITAMSPTHPSKPSCFSTSMSKFHSLLHSSARHLLTRGTSSSPLPNGVLCSENTFTVRKHHKEILATSIWRSPPRTTACPERPGHHYDDPIPAKLHRASKAIKIQSKYPLPHRRWVSCSSRLQQKSQCTSPDFLPALSFLQGFSPLEAAVNTDTQQHHVLLISSSSSPPELPGLLKAPVLRAAAALAR